MSLFSAGVAFATSQQPASGAGGSGGGGGSGGLTYRGFLDALGQVAADCGANVAAALEHTQAAWEQQQQQERLVQAGPHVAKARGGVSVPFVEGGRG